MKIKRFTALILSICLCFTAIPAASAVYAESQDTQLQIIRAMGILTGDQNGNLNLGSSVTRAQFVKMMCAASVYKDSLGNGSGVSLFKDVKKTYWGSEYIKLAIEKGWVYGYVDGSFRPNNSITLEEACTALLRLLGYDSSKLTGSYPSAQLSKAYAIGLRDDLSASQGTVLTRQDCVTLFYNLLLSEDAEGKTYGTTLGYTIANDQIDYSSLVTKSTEGPYVSDGTSASLSFVNSNTSVFRNGTSSSISSLSKNDVYYYSSNMNTVWIYDTKISGTLTAVSPNTASPETVSVSGVSYKLGTSTAEYKCSSLGSFKEGDLVTLLLGRDGDVVDIISPSNASSTSCGVVISSDNVSTTTSDKSALVQKKTVIACTDGTERTFYHTGATCSVGDVVSVTVNADGTSITNAKISMSGSVSKDASSFGGVKFATGVGIIDTDEYGNYKRIYPSRLAGCSLQSSNVIYYEKNSSGEITSLILRDATGDVNKYVYITEAETRGGDLSTSASYTYFADGMSNTINSDVIYGAGVGGAMIIYKNGQIKTMRSMKSVSISSLDGTLSAKSANTDYDIMEDVQVLIKDSSGKVYATELSAVNTKDYTLTGWYDDMGYPAGQSIRIIVAAAK